MTRKHWMLILFAVLLAGFSLYLNKDWFAKDSIQIYHRSRPARAMMFGRKRAATATTDPLAFGFNHRLKLKDVKVISLSELATNKYPRAIWHLLSDSNSLPVKDFFYGQPIPGMRPAIQGAVPDALEPGVQYRLYVQGEEFKGEHDFAPNPKTP